MRRYFVYILTNFTNKVLYIGITNDLIRRVYEHKQKLVDGFTKRYNINKLVYYEIFEDPENAIMREKALKNLLRKKKMSLIQMHNPNFEEIVTQ